MYLGKCVLSYSLHPHKLIAHLSSFMYADHPKSSILAEFIRWLPAIVVNTATSVFSRGANATSLNQVLQARSLPTGSLFLHVRRSVSR